MRKNIYQKTEKNEKKKSEKKMKIQLLRKNK